MSHLSQPQLTALLTKAASRISVGSVYRHYKNGEEYKVISIGILESTDEICVIYQAEYGDNLIFVRPVREWLEDVEWEGSMVKRFTKI